MKNMLFHIKSLQNKSIFILRHIHSSHQDHVIWRFSKPVYIFIKGFSMFGVKLYYKSQSDIPKTAVIHTECCNYSRNVCFKLDTYGHIDKMRTFLIHFLSEC